jgi:hypothetical protein
MPKARVPDGAGYRSPVAVSGPVLFLPATAAKMARIGSRSVIRRVESSAARATGARGQRPETVNGTRSMRSAGVVPHSRGDLVRPQR